MDREDRYTFSAVQIRRKRGREHETPHRPIRRNPRHLHTPETGRPAALPHKVLPLVAIAAKTKPRITSAPLANSVTQTDPSATVAADGSLINEFNP